MRLPALFLLAALPVAAAAQDGGAAPLAPAPPSGAAPVPGVATPPPAPSQAVPQAPGPSGPSSLTPPRAGWGLHAGFGYYEAVHAGVSYHVDPRAAFFALGGVDRFGDGKGYSAGAGFAHALGSPVLGAEWGWQLKAVYWTQSDPNYDWKNMSLVAGGYLVRELAPHVSAQLDGGVSLNWSLQSDRKQDIEFGHPTRWNGSLCLELVYRP
jgi:hypothetical protein